MNIRAAMIHMIGDVVQSIGVVIAAIIIYCASDNPNVAYADPACTVVFTFLCLLTTIPIFKDCMVILMEAAPKELSVTELFNDLIDIEAVDEIHDFHVWCLSVGKMAMSAHIRSHNPEVALKQMNKVLKKKYSIFHTTIQIEKSNDDSTIFCDSDA
jgi:zinc transporter 2